MNIKKIKAFAVVVTLAVLALVAVGLFEAITQDAQAQPSATAQYNSPTIVINSSGAPGTNTHFGVTTNGYYATWIAGGDLVTNFTPSIDLTGVKSMTVQLSGSSETSIGAVPSQTAILTMYRSVSGGAATNSTGTGLLFDTLGTLTLPMTINTTGPWTVCTNFSISAAPLIGPERIYFGKLDLSAMTNAVHFTNYTVRVNLTY